ncbi:ATP-binding protein [Streptomyces camponoticapitis]|uniref:ATP-binding protein n=1 Tax=Streptomyces camponoticapitis TaxID=1616125 RepID=A0ABQ2EVJ2_9ACTN|nr:ATP-binding protein [Streptomyces camponoticapitis]GGK27595.1 ATP-binding protein [Streptomyces camponoticapitis]
MDLTASDGEEQPGLARTFASASAVYDGEPQSIPEARQFTREFLTRVQAAQGILVSAPAIGTAQLVVSELVTNVCKYAPGPCLLDLRVAGDMLMITVWDSDPALPAVLETDPTRIGQHGMEIVRALCQSLNIDQEPVGKRITARLPLSDSQAPTAPGR